VGTINCWGEKKNIVRGLIMKNNDYWMRFTKTGRIDDYLIYIACTREESSEELGSVDLKREGEAVAGSDLRDRNGSVSHADRGV